MGATGSDLRGLAIPAQEADYSGVSVVKRAGGVGRVLEWGLLEGLLVWLVVAAFTVNRESWPGLVGDEATYLMQAESLAFDGDLRFAAEDLERFRSLHPWPPEVILQSGDGGNRVAFGKPFLYAAAIAPFVRLFGENGATGANALFLAVSSLLAALALSRSKAVAGPLWVAVFVFVSVTFAHVFWIHSDLFYMCTTASGLAGVHLLAVGSGQAKSRSTTRRILLWGLLGALLAVAGVSRPPYLLVLVAAALAVPREERRTGLGGLAAGAVLVLMVSSGAQFLTAGGLSPYGGERRGFSRLEGFPGVDFPAEQWAQAVAEKGNTSWLGPGSSQARLDLGLLGWNSLYLFLGRQVGILPYFFPACLALLGLRRSSRVWVSLAVVAGVLTTFMVLLPFNFYGGAGSLANRYFLPIYPLLWFLVPVGARRGWPLAAAVVAATFIWPLWTSASSYPVTPDGYRFVPAAARRWLPVESTQRHAKAPGRADVLHQGLWLRFLNGAAIPVGTGAERLRVVTGRPVELLVGSATPLAGLEIEALDDVSGELQVLGSRVQPRDSGAGSWTLDLGRPSARHEMWWTPEPFSTYHLRVRFDGPDEVVELRLREAVPARTSPDR